MLGGTPVHDEGEMDDADERGDVGEVGDPAPVVGDPAPVRGRGLRRRGPEGRLVVTTSSFAADRSGASEFAHDAFDGAAGHHTLAVQQSAPQVCAAVGAQRVEGKKRSIAIACLPYLAAVHSSMLRSCGRAASLMAGS